MNKLLSLTRNLTSLTMAVGLSMSIMAAPPAPEAPKNKKDSPYYPIPYNLPSLTKISAETFNAAKAVVGSKDYHMSFMEAKDHDDARKTRLLRRILTATKEKPVEIRVIVYDDVKKTYLMNGYKGSAKVSDKEFLSKGIPLDQSPILLVAYTSAETNKKVYYQFDLTGRC